MKKVLSLILMLLLLAGCAPRPAQTEFAPTTDVPATAEPTEAPIDDSLVLLPDDPHRKPRSAGEGL